jgi:hypothetical protein
MYVVHPATERWWRLEDGICKWLELNVVVKGCTAVFAWKDILGEAEPFFDRTAALW